MLMELQVTRALAGIALAFEAPFIPVTASVVSGRSPPALPPSPGMAVTGMVLAVVSLLLLTGLHSLEEREGWRRRLPASLGMVVLAMLFLAGGVGAFLVHQGSVMRVLLGVGNAALMVIVLRFLSPWIVRSR